MIDEITHMTPDFVGFLVPWHYFARSGDTAGVLCYSFSLLGSQERKPIEAPF